MQQADHANEFYWFSQLFVIRGSAWVKRKISLLILPHFSYLQLDNDNCESLLKCHRAKKWFMSSGPSDVDIEHLKQLARLPLFTRIRVAAIVLYKSFSHASISSINKQSAWSDKRAREREENKRLLFTGKRKRRKTMRS